MTGYKVDKGVFNRFVFNTSQVKEVRDGHCISWNYHYKEYIFNDNEPHAYSIRIPQGTVGIQAILMSNDSGIKDEFHVVTMVDGDEEKELFNITKCYGQRLIYEIEKLRDENSSLKEQLHGARAKLEAIRAIA